MLPERNTARPGGNLERAGELQPAAKLNRPTTVRRPPLPRKSNLPRPPPRRGWLTRLVHMQLVYGAEFLCARVVHQVECGISRGKKCSCRPDTFVILKSGVEIAV